MQIFPFAIIFILANGSLLVSPVLFPISSLIKIFLIFTALFVLCLVLHARRASRFWGYAAFAVLSLGYVHFVAGSYLQQAESITKQTKLTADIQIEQILHQTDYQTLIATAELPPNQDKHRIYINWKADSQPQAGETWQAELQLRPLSARLNFSGFDRQQWFFANKVTAQANVKQAHRLQLDEFPFNRQQRLQQALQQTSALPNQGLLLALGFGERAWLDNATWRIYQQTNTAHLIAISGLHIGLAMAIGFLLARASQFLLPTRWISPIYPLFIGSLFALFYAYLAGFAVPTLRAIIALILVFSVRQFRRYYSPFQLFILGITCLLIGDPLMPLSTSFWLSVGAVASLILWYQYFPLSLLEWRHLPLNQLGRLWHWGFGLIHLQLGLLLLFTPIQLFLFNGVGANGFFANLIAVPFYSFVFVPIVLFAVLTNGALYSWQLADWLASLINPIIAWFNGHWFGVSINGSLWLSIFLSLGWSLALYWLYSKQNQAKRAVQKGKIFRRPKWGFNLNTNASLPVRLYLNSIWGGVLVAGFCGIYLFARSFPSSHWRLEMLDVGQGLATLIVKNGKGLLYDTGASWQGGSMAELEILPYLQREGIELEMLILSHDDNDHSGGANAILQQFPQAKFISSSQRDYGLKNFPDSDRSFCVAGEHWQWQGLRFDVLSPSHIVERAQNVDSCVLLIRDEWNHKILLTGDIDSQTEAKLADQVGKIDVLQVAHHGSKTSSSEQLLAKIKPDFALISASRWNQWHFPHQSVVERLQRHHSSVQNTAFSGQIRVTFREDRIEIDKARNEKSPWFARIIGLSEQ